MTRRLQWSQTSRQRNATGFSCHAIHLHPARLAARPRAGLFVFRTVSLHFPLPKRPVKRYIPPWLEDTFLWVSRLHRIRPVRMRCLKSTCPAQLANRTPAGILSVGPKLYAPDFLASPKMHIGFRNCKGKTTDLTRLIHPSGATSTSRSILPRVIRKRSREHDRGSSTVLARTVPCNGQNRLSMAQDRRAISAP